MIAVWIYVAGLAVLAVRLAYEVVCTRIEERRR